jgi:hypothetical protein
MSNTKHTPGPWTIDEKLEGQTCITSKQHGSFAEPIICRVFDSSHVPLSEQDANARLIAAAPELLEALQMMANKVFGYGYGELTEDDRQRIIALLDKATGTNA